MPERKTPEQVALEAVDAAVAVELARDYRRNLTNSTELADLSRESLSEYRDHVRKIVETHASHSRAALLGRVEADIDGGETA